MSAHSSTSHTLTRRATLLAGGLVWAGRAYGQDRPDIYADIDAFFRSEIEAKRLPGAVVTIARDGKVVHARAYGARDPVTGAPMALDSIFRIYSMTKPITGLAVMMLLEAGKLRLSDPVSDYLPAFKNPRVMIEQPDAMGNITAIVVPANREITIEDLLRHTSGITYGAGHFFAEQAMVRAGLGIQLGLATKQPLAFRMTDQEMVAALGKLPLAFHPGTKFAYGRSTDVLLALVEVLSGQRADIFYAERIFQPLGMIDTFFNVPKDKLDRVAQPDTEKTTPLADVTRERLFLGGGEGLLSTAADYLRFALLLANRGELDGVRLLSPDSVDLMTINHLRPDLVTPGADYGYGFAIGVRIHEGSKDDPGHVGEFTWGGSAGTNFWVDPARKLVAIMMIQAAGAPTDYEKSFRKLVYRTGAFDN